MTRTSKSRRPSTTPFTPRPGFRGTGYFRVARLEQDGSTTILNPTRPGLPILEAIDAVNTLTQQHPGSQFDVVHIPID